MIKNPFTLRKEIALILTAKLILIFALWALFFQHPVEESLTNQAIAEHVFS